jgi:hypothetical protein
MKIIKTFAYSFKKSLLSPLYYKDVAKSKVSFNVKYLLFLLYLSALISSFYVAAKTIRVVPEVTENTRAFVTEVSETYPSELEINIKDGLLTTNVEEPYAISYTSKTSEFLNSVNSKEDYLKLKNFIVIDTSATGEDFANYNAFAVVTSKYLYFYDDDTNGFRAVPLENIDNFKLNQEIFMGFLTSLDPFIQIVPSIMYGFAVFAVLIGPFIVAAGNFIGKMVFIFITALVLWGLSGVLKRGFSYKEIVKMSMHGVTLSVLASLLGFYLGFSFFGMFGIIFLAFMTFVLAKQPRKKY